ncbi:MAG: hypothetical protein U9N10_08080 [Bacillota bacterium]|nr:hypothetical protein [Bacillota bacterium]
MNHKILGIIGGMGHKAIIPFYNKIIKFTNIKKDQDYFKAIIDSNTKTPDETNATNILTFTAHYFINELK